MDHDNGYKLLFSQPRMVEQLLRGFVHESWVETLDYKTLEHVSASFVTDDLRERRSDMIWRARWGEAGGEWLYVYLLLEFQSTPEPFMAVRLLSYLALLLGELIRAGQLTLEEGLPAVLPLVLYNGKRPWTAPLGLRSLFKAVPPGLERHLPQLDYLLVDEGRLRPEEVDLPGNSVATLFRLETCPPGEVPDLTRRLAAALPRGQEPELRRAILAWLVRLVQHQAPGITMNAIAELEEVPMLEETLIEWQEQVREEGHLAGMRRMLLRLLEQRFGRLPERVRHYVEALSSAEDLERLEDRALEAETLFELGLA
jgi:Putative transposase, YhgA-like